MNWINKVITEMPVKITKLVNPKSNKYITISEITTRGIEAKTL